MAKVITATTAKSFGLIKFLISHWYLVILLLVIIPSVIGSIREAKETSNLSYPFIKLGIMLVDADTLIYKDVQTLKEDPSKLIGMEKPSEGLLSKLKYYWLFFKNVIWRIFGNLWLITLPFILFYKVLRSRNISEPAKNVFIALFLGILFMFVINLILITHGLLQGNSFISLPENTDTFIEIWEIIKLSMPFKGIFATLKYIISLA